MARDGSTTMYIDGDVSGLKKASRDATKELQNVAKAADKANTDAARGSAKALAGISRLISSGKVTAKSLDKIGKSASGAISAATGVAGGIGVALGLGALPALSDLAVKAIGNIRESLTPLSTRISNVAAALDTLNESQLALVDSQLGIVDANKGLSDSLRDVSSAQKDAAKAAAEADAARKGRIVDTAKVTRLTEQHHNALRALTAAELGQDTAQRHLTDATKKHGAASTQSADASDRVAKAALRVAGAKEKERSVLRELDRERKGHKATEEEVAKLTDKQTAATEKAKSAALTAAHAQVQVTKADSAQIAAKAAVTKNTAEFESKLKSLTATANANNVTLHHTSGRFTDLAVDTKKAAADVSKGLRDWANSQDGLSKSTKTGALAAADLIDETHKIPKNITTTFAQPGQKEANKATDLYQRLLGEIDEKVSTRVSAPGLNRALGDAKGLYSELSRLDGKTVNTYTINHRYNRGQDPNAATGARIGGTFDGKDNIPVNVSKGEVILNPRQQRAVDGGATINQALAGAPTIRAGGGFAGGGKSKKPHHGAAYRKAQVALEAAQKRLRDAEKKHGKGSLEYRQAQVAVESAQAALRKASSGEKHHATEVLQDRNQRVLDSAKDKFGSTMSGDDLALAKAEQTGTFTDDAAVYGAEKRHILARIAQIHRLRRRKGLTRQQKQDLNDEEAGLIRQLGDIGQSLSGGALGGGDGGVADVGTDPFALSRATEAGVASGLGRAAAYVFGGSGDIGSGGLSALGASGSIPALHVESLTFTNSVQNQTQVAKASNVGNDIVSSSRLRNLRSRATF